MLTRRLFILLLTLMALLSATNSIFAYAAVKDKPPAPPDYAAALQIGRGDIRQVEWQPDGTGLLVSTERGTWVYDDRLNETAQFAGIQPATFSPEGFFMAGVDEQNQVLLWNARNLDAVSRLYQHEYPVIALEWSPAGDRIASLDGDGRIIIYSISDGTIGHLWLPDGVQIEWSPGGTALAGRSENGNLMLWNAATRHVISQQSAVYTSQQSGYANYTSIIGMAWRSDTEILAWGISPSSEFGDSTIANLWTMDGGYSNMIRAAEVPIRGFNYHFNRQGNQVAGDTGTRGGVLYDFNTDETRFTMDWNREQMTVDGWTTTAAQNMSGRTVAVAMTKSDFSADQIQIVDARTLAVMRDIPVPERVEQLIWHPDGIRLVSVGAGSYLQLINTQTGETYASSTDYTHIQNVTAWSSDGKYLASADDFNTIRVWDTTTGVLVASVPGHYGTINELAWQPGGYLLASRTGVSTAHLTNTDDEVVILRDFSSLDAVTSIQIRQKSAASLAWSHDGTQLAILSRGGELIVWDAVNQRQDYQAVLCDKWGCDWNTYEKIGWSVDSRYFYTYATFTGSSPAGHSTDVWNAQDGSFIDTVGSGEAYTGEIMTPRNEWLVAQWGDQQGCGGGSPQRYALTVYQGFSPDETLVVPEAVELDPFPATAAAASFSPDGRLLVGHDTAHHAMVWSVPEMKRLYDIEKAEHMVWSPNSQQFAILNDGEPVQIVDAASGRILDTLAVYHSSESWWEREVAVLLWSPDNRQIALVQEGIITLWR